MDTLTKGTASLLNSVVCGEALVEMNKLEDASVDLILTDPPYGMDYQSSRRTTKYEKIAGDVDLSWFPEFARESFRVLKEDRHGYIFCNDYAISDFRKELENAGFTVKRTLVWVKNNHTSGDLEGDYGNKTEFILFVHKGRRELNGKRDTNVLNFARSNNDLHPTQKPVELCRFLIDKSTKEGELVLDPYSGSFTTAVAAKELQRAFVGIEIDPTYCERGQSRINSIPNSLFPF